MITQTNQHTHRLLKTLDELLGNRRKIGVFRALVALFSDCKLRTKLQNINGISASTASRFFSFEHASDEVFWRELNDWQRKQFGSPKHVRMHWMLKARQDDTTLSEVIRDLLERK